MKRQSLGIRAYQRYSRHAGVNVPLLPNVNAGRYGDGIRRSKSKWKSVGSYQTSSVRIHHTSQMPLNELH